MDDVGICERVGIQILHSRIHFFARWGMQFAICLVWCRLVYFLRCLKPLAGILGFDEVNQCMSM